MTNNVAEMTAVEPSKVDALTLQIYQQPEDAVKTIPNAIILNGLWMASQWEVICDRCYKSMRLIINKAE